MSRMKRSLAVLSAIGFIAAGYANAVTVDFEGLTTGVSVNGQAGWTTVDEWGSGPVVYDEEVVDDGSGNNVWRVSTAVTTTGFSALPYSHTTPNVAGETGAALWNDRGPNPGAPLSPPNPGATASTKDFYTSFRFRSATGAAQPDLQISVSPSAKQSAWRNSYVNIVDDGSNGFDIFFYETGAEADPFGAGANFPEVASDLSYDQWHTIEMEIEFVDGTLGSTFGNDIVTVSVDGSPVYTGTTWESFYRGANPAGLGAPPQLQAVDSILFRLNNSAPGTSGNGLFFDDVVIGIEEPEEASVPEPASLTLLVCGIVAMARAARRRKRLS